MVFELAPSKAPYARVVSMLLVGERTRRCRLDYQRSRIKPPTALIASDRRNQCSFTS